MIDISLNKAVIEVGEVLEGTLNWSSSNKQSPNMTLSIGWRTEGRGDIESQHLYKEEVIMLPYNFRYQIPIKAPVSYDGKLIRIIWEVIVSLESKKFLGTKQDIFPKVFRVLPRMV